ncbi:DNA-binding protein [Klebsiella variicola]|uniref:DNA-binding protein n=1 Tax=Klebsiella variicola TaxID=244366 RepID=A0A7H4MHR8_KLEVA|nr:DNA-binding protein [Klebsiella variicola]
MAGRIDYDIEKYQFTEAGESHGSERSGVRSIWSVVSSRPGLRSVCALRY